MTAAVHYNELWEIIHGFLGLVLRIITAPSFEECMVSPCELNDEEVSLPIEAVVCENGVEECNGQACHPCRRDIRRHVSEGLKGKEDKFDVPTVKLRSHTQGAVVNENSDVTYSR